MNLSLAVRKRYGSFTLAADFKVSGDRIGVFGVSGSGKSTLVGMLAGLVKPDSGEIMLDGDCLFSSDRGIDQPPGKRRIAMVFQQHELFPHLNVKNNLLYGYKRSAPEHRRIDCDRLVEVLQIGPLLDRGIDNLSGGEKQRVAIGRAVLSSPRLLLMDEPLSALDDNLRFQIIPYLKSVSEQFSIPYLFISHSLNEMRLMTDQVLEFSAGGLRAQTTAHELALRRMGTSQVGYINLMELRDPRTHDGLYIYRWGSQELILSAGGEEPVGMFELSSKDITLFKRHPEATSARNMLRCRVKKIFAVGNRVGLELDCAGQHLISQVVGEAARDLGLEPGAEIIAVIKASAFRRLF